MSSNTRAIHPASQHLDLQQNGDSNGCEVVGTYITIHQGQSWATHGCAARVQGDGIGISQDGDDNDTQVVGAEHEVIQSGHQNQAHVLGGLGHQVTQNGFGSRVSIDAGNYSFNSVQQHGPASSAELRGSRNRISQDGGPTVCVRGHRNRVRQHGLDNTALIRRNRNVVRQSGNQNELRVAGNQNDVRSSGFGNRGSVRGDGNCLAIAGKGNRIVTRGSGNMVDVKGKRNRLKIVGDKVRLQVTGCGLQGTFANGVFVPAEGFSAAVSLVVVECAGVPVHLLSVC